MSGALPAPRRRDEALAFIIDRLVKTGSAPSYDEIGRQLRVSKPRARELVDQLIADGVIEKTPGAMRGLRVRDVVHARQIAGEFARSLGWTISAPMGFDLLPPFPQVQLPILPPFEHLPDAN